MSIHTLFIIIVIQDSSNAMYINSSVGELPSLLDIGKVTLSLPIVSSNVLLKLLP